MGLILLLFLFTRVDQDPWAFYVDAPQSTFDVYGPVAQQQLDLFYITLWITLGIFVVVGGVLAWVTLKYRVRKGERYDDKTPSQSHGNPLIEISLIGVSVFLLVIIAVPTVRGIFQIYGMPDDEDALTIRATGWQWWWSFEYDVDGVTFTTANEAAIPVGRKIIFELRSMDGNHSFWVPKLAGKVDMIPNRENFLWLQADVPGEYYGQCAEFCGESHANMKFRIHAMEEEDFAAWVAHESSAVRVTNRELAAEEPEMVAKGYEVFMSRNCIECHHLNGLGGGIHAPNLSHFANRGTLGAGMMPNTAENLRRWLREPGVVKPGNLMALNENVRNLTDSEIDALVVYLRSLD